MSKKNILIIAAHPDDEILGCGGTIDKFSRAGHKIYTLILGAGLDSRNIKKKMSQIKKIYIHSVLRRISILELKMFFLKI